MVTFTDLGNSILIEYDNSGQIKSIHPKGSLVFHQQDAELVVKSAVTLVPILSVQDVDITNVGVAGALGGFIDNLNKWAMTITDIPK